jgi:hypothetical protein
MRKVNSILQKSNVRPVRDTFGNSASSTFDNNTSQVFLTSMEQFGWSRANGDGFHHFLPVFSGFTKGRLDKDEDTK